MRVLNTGICFQGLDISKIILDNPRTTTFLVYFLYLMLRVATWSQGSWLEGLSHSETSSEYNTLIKHKRLRNIVIVLVYDL